jgi:hypothetical protein
VGTIFCQCSFSDVIYTKWDANLSSFFCLFEAIIFFFLRSPNNNVFLNRNLRLLERTRINPFSISKKKNRCWQWGMLHCQSPIYMFGSFFCFSHLTLHTTPCFFDLLSVLCWLGTHVFYSSTKDSRPFLGFERQLEMEFGRKLQYNKLI